MTATQRFYSNDDLIMQQLRRITRTECVKMMRTSKAIFHLLVPVLYSILDVSVIENMDKSSVSVLRPGWSP